MSNDRGGHVAKDHGEFDELAVGWAMDALEPEDAGLFTGHLPGCARCQRAVDETRDVMAAMAAAAPAAEPPEGLGRRLHAAVERTEQEHAPAPPSDLPVRVPVQAGGSAAPGGLPRPRRVWTTALVAAAVAAVLGLGTWTVLLDDARDQAQATAAAQAELVEQLLRPGSATITPISADDGRSVATVLARGDQLQLVTHGLSRNDTSQTTYVMWGIGEAAPEPLGTFDVDDTGPDLQTFADGGADSYSEYGISLEPGREAPAAPTDIVASGDVAS